MLKPIDIFHCSFRTIAISNATEKRIEGVEESTITDHLLQCDSLINFDHFDILACDTNEIRWVTKEGLFIKRDKPVLNRTIKSFSLKLSDQ